MKFNRTLRGYITKYKYSIPQQCWFDYKMLKKQLKQIKKEYRNIIQPSNNNGECCICLEEGYLMEMFCCKQFIHHKCLVHVFASTTILCPLCRANIHEYMISKSKTHQQKLDTTILSLLSNIYLNIMKIENVYNNKIILNPKILEKYCSINYTAIIKICKKIKKCLYIDVLDLYIGIINKRKIIKPLESSEHHKCIIS